MRFLIVVGLLFSSLPAFSSTTTCSLRIEDIDVPLILEKSDGMDHYFTDKKKQFRVFVVKVSTTTRAVVITDVQHNASGGSLIDIDAVEGKALLISNTGIFMAHCKLK